MYYYHSSAAAIAGEYLHPRPSWVINNESAVFVATRKYISMMFIGKWNDDEIIFGQTGGGPWTATERKPGMFKKHLFGKTGWVYKVDRKGFRSDKRLGLRGFELINPTRVKIISREFIPDLWEKLQRTPIQFVWFKSYAAEKCKAVVV